jgi:hypothetical protein
VTEPINLGFMSLPVEMQAEAERHAAAPSREERVAGMNNHDVTDEQIGAYWDAHQAAWWVGVPDGEKARQRARYIRDVRANPEALRQLAEIVGEEAS